MATHHLTGIRTPCLHSRRAVSLLALFIGSVLPGYAEVKTWIGGSNFWDTASAWNPAGVPGSGDTVVIAGVSSHVLLTNATTIEALWVTNGATLTFSNWNTCLTVLTDVVVSNNNALITHVANSDTNWNDGWTEDARVWIVCSNLTVTTGGRIDVSARGFRGGSSPSGYNWQLQLGCGPGGNPPGYDSNRAGSGGSYGGRGGATSDNNSGPRYGSAFMPTNCGSGGSARPPGSPGDGGNGGGAVWIVASGTVTVAGTGYIAANGGNGSGYEGGGGSGGSILIQCGTLTGNGSLQAKGGDRSTWNGENSSGGGGRIALHYTNWNFQGTINIRGGVASAGWGRAGDPGTLYTSGGEIFSTNMFNHGFRYAGAATSWAPASLRMTNAVIWLDRNVTFLQVGGNCLLNNNSELRVFGSAENTNMTLFTVGQDLILTNGSTLYVYSGVTNEGPDGAEVVTVGRDVIIATNCAIYPTSYGSLWVDAQHNAVSRHVNPEIRYPAWGEPARTNGGSVRFEVGRDLWVMGGGAFNANGRGYAGGFYNFTSPGGNSNEWNLGWGPGAFNNNKGPGAGHGGVGGKSKTGLGGGPAYGDRFAPTKPGSGGSYNSDRQYHMQFAGDGGGVVRVKAVREARIDGTVSANGQNANDAGGGGSGGSVWIWCKTFSGNGTITANGGNGGSGYGGGGGAGGRIAIWYRQWEWSGTPIDTNSVAGGISYGGSSTAGEVGTVVFQQRYPAGTLMIIK